MIAIRGIHSKIAICLIDWLRPRENEVLEIKRGTTPPVVDRYLICQGILHGKRRIDQTWEEICETYHVNYEDIVSLCDYIFDENNNARICVVGSESGISSSYDEIYSDSKRLLHHYVETKKIKSTQQFVCVAPSIIEDAGMTTRRVDRENLARLREAHPKGRFLSCNEVARMIHFLLYVDVGYTTGVVIRMNGGKHIL